jgi:hypothetical protein
VDVAIDVNSITFQNGYSKAVSPSGATAMRIRGNVSMSGGGATFTLTNATTQVGGAFTRTAGTLTPGTGTVIFNSSTSVSHTFGGQSFNKVIINDGLVGYWNLDGSVTDGSGYGNAGALHGTTSFTATVPGTVTFSDPDAATFDGLTGYAQVATPVNMPAAGVTQTISLWAKFPSSIATQAMVALTGAGSAVELGLGSSNIRVWKSSGTDLAHVAAPIDGAWHHIAYVYDPSAGTTDKLYIDGALTSGLGVAHDAGAVTGVFIGADSASTNFFNGSLDDVRIYNRALTITEVGSLALGGLPGTAAATHTFGSAFVANGDFVIASGGVTGTKALTVGGSWLNYGGIFTGTGLVTLSGASAGAILSGSQTMGGGLTISSGTYTLSDRLWAQSQTVTVNGTLNDGSYVVHAGGLTGSGTFNPGTGTVVLNKTANLGVATLNNLRLEDSKSENNLVAYWKLDEGNGATFHDLTGSANTGTLTGGATWTSAAPGISFDDAAALNFDGSTGYASMGTNNIPAANKAQTISFWAKFPSTDSVHDMVTIMDPGDMSGLEIGINAGNLNVWEYGGPILISMAAPSTNTWHHIAYVYDNSGAGTDQLYVDGVLNTGGGNTTTHQTGSPTVAYLGTWNAGSEVYNGQLDDVRVYKVALTAAEITQLAAGRYAGTGGYATTTLGTNTTVSGLLSLDAEGLTTSSFTLSATQPSSIIAGTYTVGTAAQTFSGSLTVYQSGTVKIASGGSVTSSGLTVQTSGTVTITGGTLSSGGMPFVLGGALTLTGGSASSGALTAQTGSSITLTGGGSISSGDLTAQSGVAVTVTNSSVSSANVNVQAGATLTLAGGSVAITGGKAFTMDGTLAASASSTIASVTAGTYYSFKIGSTGTATPTLNITSLAVQGTDTNGMWINANASATTTFTRFDGIAFSNGTGTQLLQIYAPTLYLASNGCTFDGSTTYAIALTGNGTGAGAGPRAVFGDATCATKAASGLCATSEKLDDDANNDGVADHPATNGAVVQFTRAADYAGGTFQGFPTAAFDWNTFSYYATYAAFQNAVGNADTVYVRDESGNALYSWTTASTEHLIGTPQWTTVASTHYLYVATNKGANAGKIYRFIDNGSSLTVDATWGAANPYLCTCTVSSQLSLDASNVYWAATTSSGPAIQQLWEVGQAAQSVMTGWPVTTPKNVTTSSPQLWTSSGTTLYLGIAGDLLQLDVTGTTFVTNTNPGTVNGRVSVGSNHSGITRVFAGDNSHMMWAISPTNFTGANYIWKYNTVSNVGGSSYYDNTTDTLQFGTAGGTVIVLTGAGNGGSPGTGVVLNSSYPYTLNASDPITSAPLYYGGVLVVGTTLGKLYFLDRNTGNATAPAGVSLISEYYFGPTEAVSGIGFDSNTNRYMVSTSSGSKLDGRLYYFDLVTDPTPTYQ